LKYKIYEKGKNEENVVARILKNRGIEDYNTYLNLDDSVIIPYNRLDNIEKAVECYKRHIDLGNKIGILIDTDVDGFCSASMMYSYTKRLLDENKLVYVVHSKAKAHGLGADVEIQDDIKLLIIPDAGTNDTEECKKLYDKNIDIIILDHHEKESENPYAIIVNNQMSENYENKSLCGAGVVYKFLQALDEEMWMEEADNYLDLCALANISDVMDMRSYETRRIVNKGLSNIINKCFLAFNNAQIIDTGKNVNIHNIQWNVTNILNGCIRMGSLEDQEILFRSFIETDEVFDYKTRANKDKPSQIVEENIYDRAVRLSKNAKSRQDRAREKSFKQLVEIVRDFPKDDKIVMVDVSEILDNSLTGVTAIKLAEYCRKPCILLNKHVEKENVINENGENEIKSVETFGGSGRNFKNSIESLKDTLEEIKVFKPNQIVEE